MIHLKAKHIGAGWEVRRTPNRTGRPKQRGKVPLSFPWTQVIPSVRLGRRNEPYTLVAGGRIVKNILTSVETEWVTKEIRYRLPIVQLHEYPSGVSILLHDHALWLLERIHKRSLSKVLSWSRSYRRPYVELEDSERCYADDACTPLKPPVSIAPKFNFIVTETTFTDLPNIRYRNGKSTRWCAAAIGLSQRLHMSAVANWEDCMYWWAWHEPGSVSISLSTSLSHGIIPCSPPRNIVKILPWSKAMNAPSRLCCVVVS